VNDADERLFWKAQNCRHRVLDELLTRACERSVSGAENGAERAENGVSGSGAVSGF